jgi:rod shape-determining protein MreD
MLKFFCSFVYAFCLAMIIPIFFPSLYLLYFAPFLILSFYRYSLPHCLWWAFTCGLIIDLLSSQTPLGTYTINYCFTTICLYRYKFLFFEDRLSTLPVMTFCFATLSTLIQAGLIYFIGMSFSLSWQWVLSDLFLNAFQNAVYAGLAFSLPFVVVVRIRREFLIKKWRKRCIS